MGSYACGERVRQTPNFRRIGGTIEGPCIAHRGDGVSQANIEKSKSVESQCGVQTAMAGRVLEQG